MIVFGEGEGDKNRHRDAFSQEKICSFKLGQWIRFIVDNIFSKGTQLVENYIENVGLSLEFSQSENDEDVQTLSKVQKLLEQKKEDESVTFVIQGRKVPARKDVLSIRSSYFLKMFSSKKLSLKIWPNFVKVECLNPIKKKFQFLTSLLKHSKVVFQLYF